MDVVIIEFFEVGKVGVYVCESVVKIFFIMSVRYCWGYCVRDGDGCFCVDFNIFVFDER